MEEVEGKAGGVWRRWMKKLEECGGGGGKGWRGVEETKRSEGDVGEECTGDGGGGEKGYREGACGGGCEAAEAMSVAN